MAAAWQNHGQENFGHSMAAQVAHSPVPGLQDKWKAENAR